MIKTIVKIEGRGYYTGQYRQLSCTAKEAKMFNNAIEAEEDIRSGGYLREEIDPDFNTIKIETVIVL